MKKFLLYLLIASTFGLFAFSQISVYTINMNDVISIESDHPYENNTDKTWTYTEPDFIGKLQIAFSDDTKTESLYDEIYITDSKGKNIPGSPFSGTSLASKTVVVPDHTFNIRLVTDDNVTYYGFRITDITPIPLEVSELLSNIKKCTLSLNESYQLTITAKTADGYSIDVTDAVAYSSSNPSVLEVDSKTGLITAKGYGDATITASINDKSTNIIVSVLPMLSSLTVSAGTLSPVFNKKATAYTVLLPFGTKSVPKITAAVDNDGVNLEIQNATSLEENTVINLFAPDNITANTYTVSFEPSPYMESAHPYSNNCNIEWMYESDNSSGPISITFSSNTFVETGYDYIFIMDKDGNNIKGSPFTGNFLAGKTVTVPGNKFVIRLQSDNSTTDYGFKVLSIYDPNTSINEDFIVDDIKIFDS
ncbi:MAG: Bacterial Ig-like domain (group 2) [Firmicutes bacterium ADurb.Bin193]|nr:MAG: Bacterial Ig-like domain (group 2) [Firmicutes bacterium ADurb.Bin193]